MLKRYAAEAVREALGEPVEAINDDIPPPDGPSDYGLRNDNPQPIEPPPFILPDFIPLTVAEWLDRDLIEPDPILGRWLTTTSRVLLVATTGLGKSLAAMALGMAVADGVDFLHWKGPGRAARVLYIDGEMSSRLLKKRIAEEVARRGAAPASFAALSHEDIQSFPPLNTPAGQSCIEKVIDEHLGGGVDLIIFDNIMSLTTGDMKDEESWSQTLPWVRSLTRRGAGQIWIHHTGHDETRSYGSKTREWQMDTVIQLEAVKREDTDVSFSVDFRKARERSPETRDDFQPVRVALVNDRWQCDAVETKRPGHVSPLGLKFLDALNNVLASDSAPAHHGRKIAPTADWRAECNLLGLLDPAAKPDSARSLFNKHRRELVAANRIACDGDLSWTL